jgi:hypothetical protein
VSASALSQDRRQRFLKTEMCSKYSPGEAAVVEKHSGCCWTGLAHAHEYSRKTSAIMLRRRFKELESTIQTARELFPKMGGVWSNATDSHATYIFPNGARIRFRHLDNDSDASHYLGHFYTRTYIEEAGEFPSPKPIFKLMATLQVPDV